MKKWAPLGAMIGVGIAVLIAVLFGGGSSGTLIGPVLLTVASGAIGHLLLDQETLGLDQASPKRTEGGEVRSSGLKIDGNLTHSRRTYDRKKDTTGRETNELLEHFRSGILQIEESGKKGAIHLSMRENGKLVIDKVAEDFSSKGANGGIASVERKWKPLKDPVAVELGVGKDELSDIRKALAEAAQGNVSFKAAVRRALEARSDESQLNGDEQPLQSSSHANRSGDPENGKVFVANGLVANPLTGRIGAAELDWKSNRHEPRLGLKIYLDSNLNVVAVNQIRGDLSHERRTIAVDGSNLVPESATYRIRGNSVSNGKRTFHVMAGQNKGPDGKFGDDSSWFSGSSFKKFDLTIDDDGFVDLKSPEAKSGLRAAFQTMNHKAVDSSTSPGMQPSMKKAIETARDPEYSPMMELERTITTGFQPVIRNGPRR